MYAHWFTCNGNSRHPCSLHVIKTRRTYPGRTYPGTWVSKYQIRSQHTQNTSQVVWQRCRDSTLGQVIWQKYRDCNVNNAPLFCGCWGVLVQFFLSRCFLDLHFGWHEPNNPPLPRLRQISSLSLHGGKQTTVSASSATK